MKKKVKHRRSGLPRSCASDSNYIHFILTNRRPLGRRAMMQDESTLDHCEHVSARWFGDVVAAFEAAVCAGDGDTFRRAVEASTGPDDFEARMRASEGPSRFMLFLAVD